MFEYSFIDGCLYGTTDIEELDTYVEYWHTNETDNTLREFLGMHPYEYGEWLKYGDQIIRDILRCRADGISFQDYKYMTDDERIAARSYSIEEIEQLKNNNKNEDK